MGLADSLAEIPAKYSSIRCQLRTWALTLEPVDQEALWAYVYDDTKPAREIAKKIASNGHGVSASTIVGHRNGDCRTCERFRDGTG